MLFINPELAGDLGCGTGAYPGGWAPILLVFAQIRIIGIQDWMARTCQQAAFDGPVSLKAAVSFQVIGREGGPDSDGGSHPFSGLNLVTAHLHDDPVGFLG